MYLYVISGFLPVQMCPSLVLKHIFAIPHIYVRNVHVAATQHVVSSLSAVVLACESL